MAKVFSTGFEGPWSYSDVDVNVVERDFRQYFNASSSDIYGRLSNATALNPVVDIDGQIAVSSDARTKNINGKGSTFTSSNQDYNTYLTLPIDLAGTGIRTNGFYATWHTRFADVDARYRGLFLVNLNSSYLLFSLYSNYLIYLNGVTNLPEYIAPQSRPLTDVWYQTNFAFLSTNTGYRVEWGLNGTMAYYDWITPTKYTVEKISIACPAGEIGNILKSSHIDDIVINSAIPAYPGDKNVKYPTATRHFNLTKASSKYPITNWGRSGAEFTAVDDSYQALIDWNKNTKAFSEQVGGTMGFVLSSTSATLSTYYPTIRTDKVDVRSYWGDTMSINEVTSLQAELSPTLFPTLCDKLDVGIVLPQNSLQTTFHLGSTIQPLPLSSLDGANLVLRVLES